MSGEEVLRKFYGTISPTYKVFHCGDRSKLKPLDKFLNLTPPCTAEQEQIIRRLQHAMSDRKIDI